MGTPFSDFIDPYTTASQPSPAAYTYDYDGTIQQPPSDAYVIYDIYALSDAQREFLKKIKDMVKSPYHRRKYDNKVAFKERGKANITVMSVGDVLKTINSIISNDVYCDSNKPMLKKLRQHYKKYKRNTVNR